MMIHRTACCLVVAVLAAPARSDVFTADVDGLIGSYGGGFWPSQYDSPFDFGRSFRAVWGPTLVLTGHAELNGGCGFGLACIGSACIEDCEVCYVDDGPFEIAVPMPLAVELLKGQGIVALVGDCAPDRHVWVTRAVLLLQACPADTTGNDMVDVDDMVNVILDWGTAGSEHNGDVDGSGAVDVDDLLAVILTWGPCM